MFKWIKEKLMRKSTEEESCEFDFGKSLKSTLNKRFDREAEARNIISGQYDIETLSDSEYNTLLHEEFSRLREEEKAEELRKKASLRTIKTLRTKKEIDDAIKAGQKVLKQKVEPSKEIRVTDLHIKDKQTGKISIEPYSYHAIPHDYGRYKILKEKTYYPYDFPSKEAAYLLPNGLEAGERVILEDLIEDIVGESHAWGTYRLDSAEAVWNGEKFEIDCKSYEVEITFG